MLDKDLFKIIRNLIIIFESNRYFLFIIFFIMLNTIRKSIEGLSTTKQIIGLTAIASSIAFGYYLWNNSKKTP